MEQKKLKTSVFSNDVVFNESAEQPIDIDFMLPDYYSDISKILKCRAISRISSKNINGSVINVEGCVTVTVIYCGSDNCVSSYECQYPFSKSFDTGINADGGNLCVKTKCEYINCRAVTGRKIDVHGAVGVYVTLKQRKLTEVISDIDDCNIELLQESVPATIPMGSACKYLIVEEEIELGTGQPDINCLIRYDADAVVTDSKILAGKSVVSGELAIKLLYSSLGDKNLQTVRCQLPFSQLIEIAGLTDECDCESKVEIAHLEIKPRVSATGECRQLLLNAKLLITSECCCNNDVAVVMDAYSRKYEAAISKSDVSFNKIFENINQNFSCKRNLEFAEGDVAAVLDMWCDTRVDSVKFVDNSMIVTGSVIVSMIAQNNGTVPAFYEKVIDFEYNHPLKTDDGEYKCVPEISVVNANYTITGECSLELRVELNICAAVYKCTKIPLIVDINIDNEKTLSRANQGAMVLYFAEKGEKIWDIARKYFADMNEVKQINDLNADVLYEDKMLLVPTE